MIVRIKMRRDDRLPFESWEARASIKLGKYDSHEFIAWGDDKETAKDNLKMVVYEAKARLNDIKDFEYE